MAAPKFTQDISPVSASPFVKSPVVDRSEGFGAYTDLSAFANFAGLGANVYKDVQEYQALTGLNKEIQDEIDTYMGSSPTKILEAQTDLAKSQTELNQLPSKEGGTPEEVNKAVSDILASIDTQKEFLTKAKDQNRISELEFDNRFKSAIKTKLAEYPYLKSEILNHAKTQLDLSNIEGYIKADNKLLSDQQSAMNDQIKFIRQEAKDNALDLNQSIFKDETGQTNWGMVDYVNNNIRRIKYTDNLITGAAKRNEDIDKLELRRNIKNGKFDEITLNRQRETTNALMDIFNPGVDAQGKPIPFNAQTINDAKAKAKLYIQNQIDQANLDFSKYGLKNDEVKARITAYEKSLNDTYKALSEYTDGTEIKNYLEAKKASIEATQQISFRQQVANMPEYANLMEKLANVGTLLKISVNNENYAEFLKSTIPIFQGGLDKAQTQLKNMTDAGVFSDTKTIAQEIFEVNVANLSNDTTGKVMLDKLLKETNRVMNDPEAQDADKYKLYMGYLDGINNNKVTIQDLDAIGDENKSGLLSTIDSTIPVQVSNLKRIMNENPSIKIYKDSRGLLVGSGVDPSIINSYITPINKAIKAKAKLLGTEEFMNISNDMVNLEGPVTEVMPEDTTITPLKQGDMIENNTIRPDFNSTTVPKDNSQVNSNVETAPVESTSAASDNNLTNLKNPDGKSFRQFETVKENLKASDEQLLRYVAGTGVAKGRDIKTIRDILSLWRPESDYRGKGDITQKDYEKIVADTVGVKPDEPLDLNNVEIRAKILQGIIKVEKGQKIGLQTVLTALK